MVGGGRFTGKEREMESSSSYVTSLDRLAASISSSRETHLAREEDEEDDPEENAAAFPKAKARPETPINESDNGGMFDRMRRLA